MLCFKREKLKKLYFWIRNCTFGPKCLDFSVSPWCTFKNLIFSYWDGTHRAPIFNKFNICWIQWQTLQSRFCSLKQIGLIPDFTFLRHAQKSETHKQALHGITSTRTMTTMRDAYRWCQTKEGFQEAQRLSLRSCEQRGRFPWQWRWKTILQRKRAPRTVWVWRSIQYGGEWLTTSGGDHCPLPWSIWAEVIKTANY